MSLTPTQESDKKYIEQLTSARIDELMPDNALDEAPYGFIDKELEFAGEFVLSHAPRHQIYDAIENHAGATIEPLDDAEYAARIYLGSDFLRFVRLRMASWKRPVDSVIDVDTREYKRQDYPATRGTNQRPVVAMVPYLGSSNTQTIQDITVQFNINEIITDRRNGYRTLKFKISYTHPKTGSVYQVEHDLGYVKDIQTNSDLSAAVHDYITNNPADFPDFTTTDNGGGSITFIPKSPKMDLVGAEIDIDFTHSSDVAYTVVEFNSLPGAGTTSLKDNSGNQFSYTLDGTESIDQHLNKFAQAWLDKSSLSDITLNKKTLNLVTSSYPAKLVLMITGGRQDIANMEQELKLFGVDGSVSIEFNSSGSGQYQIADTTTDPESAIGYDGSLSKNTSFKEYLGSIKISTPTTAKYVLEAYPAGNMQIKEFTYVSKLPYYDMPKSLWDPVTWYATSRVLSSLGEVNQSKVAFQNMVELLGGQLVGYKNENIQRGE